MRIAFVSLLSFVIHVASATAIADGLATLEPDLPREQRMANQIADAILDGEPIELDDGGNHRFLGIYTPAAESAARGTVVVLHGRGFHPDWSDVVQPLRIGLTERGWNTLSIQLPVLQKTAKYNDYWQVFDAAVPRIDAAIAKARQQHSGKVVLVAHSCGAHMAQRWVRTKGKEASDQVDAFAGIGLGATDFGQPMREPFAIDLLSVPVLDLYAERDFPAVHRLAAERREALVRGGNVNSAQIVVPDADHYFADRGDALVDVLADWLSTL